MKVSVVIPMYNEIRVIPHTLEILSGYMEQNFPDYEIIVCSDGSTDGCDAAVRNLDLPGVKVIAYTPNRGKGYAVRTGMLAATGDVRIFQDSDLAYGTDVIKDMVEEFEKDPSADVILGSRNLHKDGYAEYSFLRKLASKVYIRVLCLFAGFDMSDSQCGCKAFSGKAAEAVFSRCTVDGFAFDFEAILIAKRLKMVIREHPVKVIHHGSSKVHVFRDTFKMLFDLCKIRYRMRKGAGTVLR